ncbi:hypothetical protein N0V88_001794 [Collariella sp. IMI 366227]|nr:hypothetical protein N0V88_001794 [Collariella sp. IMI 366227]
MVPGPRAARLQTLFASTAKHTLDKISKDNFGACFPTVAAKAPGTLEFVQRQMVERLGGLWKKEFESIMANRQVVARLNELEALVADAAKRRREAEDTHTAHLTTALESTQASNAQLWSDIQSQRAEIESLLSGLEKVMRDIDGANEVLSEEVVAELGEETRRAEEEVGRFIS